MTGFTVPRYLAETARCDERVRGWIAGLPAIVADLAGRWSLRVGERSGPQPRPIPLDPPGQAGGPLRAGARRGHHPGTARR
jgi:hypothetical protein